MATTFGSSIAVPGGGSGTGDVPIATALGASVAVPGGGSGTGDVPMATTLGTSIAVPGGGSGTGEVPMVNRLRDRSEVGGTGATPTVAMPEWSWCEGSIASDIRRNETAVRTTNTANKA